MMSPRDEDSSAQRPEVGARGKPDHATWDWWTVHTCESSRQAAIRYVGIRVFGFLFGLLLGLLVFGSGNGTR